MNITELWLISPEILTAFLALGLFVIGLLVPKGQHKGIGYLASIGLIGILLTTLLYQGMNDSLLGGTYLVDPYGLFFKQLFLAAAILVSIASGSFVEKLQANQGEFYALLAAATLGMMLMAAAGDLIILYLGLELMTITFVILTAYQKKEAKSAEAGIKYIVLGAMSSAILLYGLSLIFGFAGSTIIADIAASLANAGGLDPLVLLGMVFLIAGFGFKVSAVPFHMWSPDIYEGAPTPVTAFLAVASKAAGLAAFVRIFLIALPDFQQYWGIILIVLATLTIVLGNLVAIPQTNIKRMLAYSSISQAGYILLGMIAFSSLGVAALLFHSLLYVFSNVGAFTVAIAVRNATGSDEIKDYSGLAQTSPMLAAVMLMSLLSLAGIPPLAGFVSKFYLFTAIIDKGLIWLAFVAIGMSMVSVYYYLIVVKAMYLGAPKENVQPIKVPAGTQLALIVCLIVIFFFGIYPTPLTNLALDVANVFFPF